VGLVEIETQWSINDLANAHEMISWKNARILDEQKAQALVRKANEAGRR
jgi:hypothetical protein